MFFVLVKLYTVFSGPRTLVKNMTKNLDKNLAKNLTKNLAENIAQNPVPKIENRREGGLQRQRPLPGNRFVSFVRVSGRACARREITHGYLELFAERTSGSSSSARGLLFHFSTQKTLKTLAGYCCLLFLHVLHKAECSFSLVWYFCIFAQGLSVKVQLVVSKNKL